MPRRPVSASGAGLSLLLCASLTTQTIAPAVSQTPTPSDNQTTTAPAVPAGNPVLDLQQTKAAEFQPGNQQNLTDYRPLLDPDLQREPTVNQKPLPLYGYDFFAPARQVIAARRAALQQALSGGMRQTGRDRGRGRTFQPARLHVATPEELETVKTLTDTQKADLLQRQRLGTLSPDEQQQYRIFLYPSTYDSRRPASRDEVDAVQALTEEQKADLFTRQREGTLGDRDRALYRILLYPMPERLPQPMGGRGQADASASLTAQQKVDLLTRQREGTLTDAEKQKYHAFLYPDRSLPTDDGFSAQADGSGASDSGDDTAENDGHPYYRTKASPDDSPGGIDPNALSTGQPPDQAPAYDPGALDDNQFYERSDQTSPSAQQPYSTPNPAANGAYGPATFGPSGYTPPSTGPDYAGPDSFDSSGSPGGAAYGSAYAGSSANRSPYAPASSGMSGGFGYSGAGTSPGYQGTPRGAQAGNAPTGQAWQAQSPDNGYPGAYGPGTPAGLPPVNAYDQIADPLATTLQQVIASAPTDYQLSAGDRVTLRYSSPTMEERSVTLTVDPQGGLAVPEAGRVIVRGMTTAQAETALARRMRGVYRNVDVSLFLQGLRTIPVTVSGASYFPGTYQVPAVATAFNILYATGGPTRDGSLRSVEVRRHGALVGTLDVYKFLSGGQTRDIGLQSGDVIVIPPHAARVAVRGEVRHPAVFELKSGETLADALRYAGGIKPSGVSQRVLVSTLDPGSARILKNVDATEIGSARKVALYDGDSVDVFSIRTQVANKVSIEGAVDQPGDYAVTSGMRVSDLVESARGLLGDAYTHRADLWRFNPDTTLTLIPIDLDKAMAHDPASDVTLTRWDKLKVYSLGEVTFLGRRDVIVNGAVQHPGVYYRGDNMRVKDLLLEAGGTLPDAYTYRAALLHQRPDGTYQYQFINLADAMKDSPADDALLQDHDVLGVYKISEAQFVPQHTFSIRGEVVAPGNSYPRGDGMHLSDAIRLAGGLLPSAGDRIAVAHARQDGFETPQEATYSPQTGAVTPDLPLKDGDVVTIQGRGSWVDHPYVVTVRGAVNKPGPVILPARHVRLSDVIRLAGGLKPEAFPEGAEFDRLPENLTTDQQKRLSTLIERVNELLNSSEYKRALAQSDIQRIQAIGKATGSQAIGIPGLTPTTSDGSAAAAAAGSPLNNRDLVTPPRDLTPADLAPAGNVAVNLKAAMRHPDGDDDILMTDGDTVIVPERPTTVQVVGAVINARGVVFHPGEKAGDYIDQAGGFAPDAAKDRVLVIRVGGGLVPIKKAREIMPGDTILVPTGVMAAKISNHQNEWDGIFRSLTNSALVFFIAKKLIGF